MKRSKPSFSGKDQKAGEVRRCNLGANVPLACLGSKDLSQVTGVPACVQRILSFTGGHVSAFDKSFLKVHLMNGTWCIVRCTDDNKVQDVIDHVVEQLGGGQKSQTSLYGLLAVCEASKKQQWLHNDMLLSHCHKEMHSLHSTAEDWRFDLKIRFFFKTCLDFLQNDLIAFNYLYEQVKNDLRSCSQYESMERDTAVKLASIEIRLILGQIPNKKVSNTVLEDIEWKKFLPQYLLQGNEAKPLCKAVLKSLKVYLTLSSEECILRYCNTVSGFWRYDEETFDCRLEDHFTSPLTVKLAVGPTICVAYETSLQPSLITLANFKQIESIALLTEIEVEGAAGQVELNLHNEQSPLIVCCSSVAQAKQLTSLIEGYISLITDGLQSFWTTPTKSEELCDKTFCSDSRSIPRKTDMPDYAILEDVVNEKSSVIKGLPSYTSACSCSQEIDEGYSLTPFSSTPDLLSNAQSSKVRHASSSTEDSETVASCHPSLSLCNNFAIGSRSPEVSKLTFEAIQEKLRFQKQQSDDDAEWLHREEAKLIIYNRGRSAEPFAMPLHTSFQADILEENHLRSPKKN